MINQTDLKVQTLSLRKFTAFDETEFNFCQGINVFIGANSTGKSHVLKIIYTLLKVCEAAQREQIDVPEKIEDLAKDKLTGVFKPDHIGRLVRRGQKQADGSVSLVYEETNLNLTVTTKNEISLTYTQLPKVAPSIFLPVHEFLSINEGFIAAYSHRETAFDETYYDLSIALNALPLRNSRLAEIKKLVVPLEKAINGQVTQEKGRFYVKLPSGKFEAHLVSEGYRKLAGLIYLINNGSLPPNGILFWDEPEANLNPKLVTVVVEALRVFVAAGMQIFIATHDYLLSQKLSLLAEYPSDTPVKFFALHQPGKKVGVIAESGDTLATITHNPILDEFAAHYDQEVQLFQHSTTETAEE